MSRKYAVVRQTKYPIIHCETPDKMSKYFTVSSPKTNRDRTSLDAREKNVELIQTETPDKVSRIFTAKIPTK